MFLLYIIRIFIKSGALSGREFITKLITPYWHCCATLLAQQCHCIVTVVPIGWHDMYNKRVNTKSGDTTVISNSR